MFVRKRVLLSAAISLLAIGSMARAQSLSVGDPAPKLEVSSFVKGEPVKGIEPGKYHVVEFWATWCGPCIATIPHLTELQKKNPEVTFIGVSVWEQDQKDVKPFVEKMGDKMVYRVAMDRVPEGKDGGDGAMAMNWMKAAAQNGIPTAFIVNKDSKIAWIGHPAKMDEPLEKIVSGSWDLQTAIAEHKKVMEEQTKMMKIQTKLIAALRGDDAKKTLAVIDEVIAEVPGMKLSLGSVRFATLVKLGETDKALEFGKELKESYGKNPQAFNALAWAVADPQAKLKPDPKLLQFAVEVAEEADRLAESKDAAIADTLAATYFKSGQKDKAIEAQERAVKLAKGTPLEKNKDLTTRLEEYKQAAKP